MGYEIHIFRLDEEKEISQEELNHVISRDETLSISDNDKNEIIWHDHPLGGIDGHKPLLYFSQGRISSRHPDEFVTKKMFEIAETLYSKLGDDEEIFEDSYRKEIEESCLKIMKRQEKKKNKPKWKFW
jgi:hypothetical protein